MTQYSTLTTMLTLCTALVATTAYSADNLTPNPFNEQSLVDRVEIVEDFSDIDTISFKDRLHGFEVKLPDEWELEQGFSDKNLDFVIVGVSPSDGPNDRFIENMNVLVEEIGNDVNLEEYFMWNLIGLVQELPNFRMLEKANVEVNGIQMARVVYSWDLDHQKTATYQYIFVKENKGYVITFSAEPKKFTAMRRTFDAVATSFEFRAGLK
jgi:hypothetical protein